MGINKNYFPVIQKALEAAPVPIVDIRMCEFGCQSLKLPGYFVGPAKLYFEGLGIQHTSFDLNGDWGAQVEDLGRLIEPPAERFHVLTNFGTSEHVEDQWECFANAHVLCETGGIMAHLVPTVDHCKGHGVYTYPVEFFEGLAERTGYEMISRGIAVGPVEARVDHAFAVMRKTSDDEFIDPESFAALPIERDAQAQNSGDYENETQSLPRILVRTFRRRLAWERCRRASARMRAGKSLGELPCAREGSLQFR
ncbi:MAG: hypothetical protein VCB42_09240 [Myxococcota bacterium]